MNAINFLIVGVGGQGILLAGDVLCQVGLAAGYNVKKTDAHGMSQRGGSVVSHVRWGPEVFSPIIPAGGADILVAFEKMEALRWLSYLSPEGMLIVNNHEIYPMPVILGMSEYPARLEETLAEAATRMLLIEAADEAAALGNPRVSNVVLLGAVVKSLGLEDPCWAETLRSCVPPHALQVNERAFRKGLSLV